MQLCEDQNVNPLDRKFVELARLVSNELDFGRDRILSRDFSFREEIPLLLPLLLVRQDEQGLLGIRIQNSPLLRGIRGGLYGTDPKR